MELKEIENEEVSEENKEGKAGKKKRGRKRIKEKPRIENQKKFFIDYTNDELGHGLVIKLMKKANDKNFGRDVVFKDLVDLAIKKLNDRDLEKVQDLTLNKMDKVQMALDKYNQKTGENLSMGEYLVKQLKIN